MLVVKWLTPKLNRLILLVCYIGFCQIEKSCDSIFNISFSADYKVINTKARYVTSTCKWYLTISNFQSCCPLFQRLIYYVLHFNCWWIHCCQSIHICKTSYYSMTYKDYVALFLRIFITLYNHTDIVYILLDNHIVIDLNHFILYVVKCSVCS